jgi:hypothetical protein
MDERDQKLIFSWEGEINTTQESMDDLFVMMIQKKIKVQEFNQKMRDCREIITTNKDLIHQKKEEILNRKKKDDDYDAYIKAKKKDPDYLKKKREILNSTEAILCIAGFLISRPRDFANITLVNVQWADIIINYGRKGQINLSCMSRVIAKGIMTSFITKTNNTCMPYASHICPRDIMENKILQYLVLYYDNEIGYKSFKFFAKKMSFIKNTKMIDSTVREIKDVLIKIYKPKFMELFLEYLYVNNSIDRNMEKFILQNDHDMVRSIVSNHIDINISDEDVIEYFYRGYIDIKMVDLFFTSIRYGSKNNNLYITYFISSNYIDFCQQIDHIIMKNRNYNPNQFHSHGKPFRRIKNKIKWLTKMCLKNRTNDDDD